IKTRCLTTWRHPSTFAPADNNAGAHLTAASGTPPALPELLVHGGAVHTACHEAHPPIRHTRGEPLRLRCAAARQEDARTGASEPRTALAAEPIERRRHLGRSCTYHRLAVVASTRLKKGAYCDEGGIPCQFRALEYLTGADPDAGIDDDVPGLRQADLGQPFPDAFCPGGGTPNKNRDIRSQWQPQGGELLEAQAAAPELVQRQKRRCGIRAAPAEPRPLGYALVHPQFRSLSRPGQLLQRARGAQRQIGLRRYTCGTRRPLDQTILPE